MAVSERCKDPVLRGYRDPVRTSTFYKTLNIPARFENSFWLMGYGMDREPQLHPLYRTSNSEYGFMAPNSHTVPVRYFPSFAEFTKEQSRGGMYRNYSLNTGIDQTQV